jgi:hypothetical protein
MGNSASQDLMMTAASPSQPTERLTKAKYSSSADAQARARGIQGIPQGYQ